MRIFRGRWNPGAYYSPSKLINLSTRACNPGSPGSMRRFARQYLEFFRQPDVARLMGVALLSRMPIGMVGLSMLMFLREALGSYALAGSVSGIYFVAMAAGSPIQGRLIDRTGPRLTLWVTGIVHPLSLLAILLAARGGLPYAAVASPSSRARSGGTASARRRSAGGPSRSTR